MSDGEPTDDRAQDQSTHDPSTHDQSTHDPSTHDPSTHDPSTHDPSTHDPSARDQSALDQRVQQLERSLLLVGVRARVEARATLAIIMLAEGNAPLDATTRRACVRAAQEAGFTHVAVEIDPVA